MNLNLEKFIAVLTVIVAIFGLVSWILILISLIIFFRQMRNVEKDKQRKEITETTCDHQHHPTGNIFAEETDYII